MSLINQMLRDLDARNASAAERVGIAEQVRALPPARKLPWRQAGALLASAACGGLVVWLFMRSSAPEEAAASMPVPQLAVPMPEAPTETAAAPLPAPRTLGDSLRGSYSLRMDTRMPQLGERSQRQEKTADGTAAPPPHPSGKPEAVQIDKQVATTAVPGDPAETEYRKGYAALKRGAGEEAVNAFRAALAASPQHAKVRQALLSLLVNQKQWQAAQTLAREGLAFDPTRMDWVILIARLHVEQGDTGSALETLAHYSPLAEQNPDYQAFYALLLQRGKRYAEAAQKYKTALELRPGEGRWWYGLGLALAAEHRDDEARAAFVKAKESGNLPPELAAQAEQRLR